MELKWIMDRNPDTYGDWDLFDDHNDLGWIRKAVSGEMVWIQYSNRLTKSTAKVFVLGEVPLRKAKTIVEAMVRLEG